MSVLMMVAVLVAAAAVLLAVLVWRARTGVDRDEDATVLPPRTEADMDHLIRDEARRRRQAESDGDRGWWP